jgi:hypothetical protein
MYKKVYRYTYYTVRHAVWKIEGLEGTFAYKDIYIHIYKTKAQVAIPTHA